MDLNQLFQFHLNIFALNLVNFQTTTLLLTRSIYSIYAYKLTFSKNHSSSLRGHHSPLEGESQSQLVGDAERGQNILDNQKAIEPMEKK